MKKQIVYFLVLGFFILSASCSKDDKEKDKPKPDPEPPAPETITDIDGNSYIVVDIGDQKWMAENLRTTKYNDGTDILYLEENSDWQNELTAAYCWYDNDISNKNKYGVLYNWLAVNSEILCPEGWRVPTHEDWVKLEGYVDSEYDANSEVWDASDARGADAGTKLKSKDGWINNGNGTDAFKFKAVPAGFRTYNGLFESAGEKAYWWSTQEAMVIFAYNRNLNADEAGVLRNQNLKTRGLSVRCVKE